MLEMEDAVIQSVRNWVETSVLGLNLCPFAHKPVKDGRLRYVKSPSHPTAELWNRLKAECVLLDSSELVSNTLFILEDQDLDFMEFLSLLEEAGRLLEEWGYEGVYQLASFHPQYLFAGEAESSRSHFTNRAPWPIFHLLREQEITRALATYRDPESIPARNIKTLAGLSEEEFRRIFIRFD